MTISVFLNKARNNAFKIYYMAPQSRCTLDFLIDEHVRLFIFVTKMVPVRAY